MSRMIIMIFSALFFLTGCVTKKEYEDTLSSWVGASENELVMSWGPPNSVYESGGLKYLTWSNSGSVTIPGTSPTYQTSIYGNTAYTTAIGGSAPMTFNKHCQRTMVISNDRVVNWQWKGNGCFWSSRNNRFHPILISLPVCKKVNNYPTVNRLAGGSNPSRGAIPLITSDCHRAFGLGIFAYHFS